MKRFVTLKDSEGKAKALSIPHIQEIDDTQDGCVVHYLRPGDNTREELQFKLSAEEAAKTLNATLEEEEREGCNKNRCPTCGRPIKICKGRFGFFIGCSGYPKCTWMTTAEEWMEAKEDPQRWTAQREVKRGKV